jgi:hypothetical protein
MFDEKKLNDLLAEHAHWWGDVELFSRDRGPGCSSQLEASYQESNTKLKKAYQAIVDFMQGSA